MFDLIYQLMGIFFDLVPVALVCFLLWRVARPHLARLGIDAAVRAHERDAPDRSRIGEFVCAAVMGCFTPGLRETA